MSWLVLIVLFFLQRDKVWEQQNDPGPSDITTSGLSSESCSKEKAKQNKKKLKERKKKENLQKYHWWIFGWRHRVPKKGWRMLILVDVQQQFLVVRPGGGIPAGRSTLLMIGGLQLSVETNRQDQVLVLQSAQRAGHLKPQQPC